MRYRFGLPAYVKLPPLNHANLFRLTEFNSGLPGRALNFLKIRMNLAKNSFICQNF